MIGWLASVGRLITFTDLGIDNSKFEDMADDLIKLYGRDKDHIANPNPIDRAGAMCIFKNSL